MIPTPNTPCPPEEPCHTLSHYVEHADQYFTSNTTFQFLPGNHTLEKPAFVENVTNLMLLGDPSSLPLISSKIFCSQPASFTFYQISELLIWALAFVTCGNDNSPAVNTTAVHYSKIADCSFQNNRHGGALVVEDSDISLMENSFLNNSVNSNIGAGGVNVSNSEVNFTGNNFIGNQGGVHMYYSAANFTGNNFISNVGFPVGGGVIVQNSTVNFMETTFENNTLLDSFGGAAGYVGQYSAVNFIGCRFENNTTTGLSGSGGVWVEESEANFTGCSFVNNHAAFSLGGTGGGVSIHNYAIVHFNGTSFKDNSAVAGGGVKVSESSRADFTRCIFLNNTAHDSGGGIYLGLNSSVSIINSSIESNHAVYGGGIAAYNVKLQLFDTLCKNNMAEYGGCLSALNSIVCSNKTNFERNLATLYGGGAYTASYNCLVLNASSFMGNSAKAGGGLLLADNAQFYLMPFSTVDFTDNTAWETGGAIEVQDGNPFSDCDADTYEQQLIASHNKCFFQILLTPLEQCDLSNIKLRFMNNRATKAGGDIYGGSIDNCQVQYCGTSTIVFNNITSTKTDVLKISSDPLHVYGCIDSSNSTSVYPGGTFEVSVIAKGQRNGNVPAVVLTDQTQQNFRISDFQTTQATNSTCTALHYTVFSLPQNDEQVFTLYIEGQCPRKQRSLSIHFTILKCPHGLQFSKAKQSCVCDERLQRYTNTCNINDGTILRAHGSNFWVSYDKSSEGLILHHHCPFDYCVTHRLVFQVDESDVQCRYNRCNLICGGCHKNFSLVFGSSRCLRCTDSYLLMLIAFGFAGIALVILLFTLKLTVAIGTISGLIFYANIIQINSSIFFPPGATNILTVFIAWLNLDLGIEVCFYNGMDAYAKTWLQFVFPIYVWVLVSVIILVSHYSSGRIARMFGRNPTAVLATLFLLSYTKLLRTIIAALSVTSLEYPGGSEATVWLYDGNIRYLRGKHIPLFTVAVVFLLFLFLPYTLLLVLGQWLQRFTIINNYRINPFLDAYHAPYTDKHRYWTGLMLLIRCFLFLIFAFNTLGDPSVNLLSISSIVAGIITALAIIRGRIYKSWYLGVVEASFLLNLVILAAATYHVKATEGNQAAAVYTSVAVAFATFIGICIYHAFLQIKDTRMWKLFSLNNFHYRALSINSNEDESEEEAGSETIPVVAPSTTWFNIREPLLETPEN